MNLFDTADFYINRIVTSRSKSKLTITEQSKIKALLLDKDTISTISMCATQSELLDHGIYFVDTIENESRDVMRHIKCMVYVKPSDETINHLLKELQNPKYGEYYIYFNNKVNKSQLERLAESDDLEVVSKIEEIFQDYQILNEDLFSLDIPSKSLFMNNMIWDELGLESCTQSIISLLLSLKLKPDIVFELNSKLCSRLAKEIAYEIETNEKALFDFSKRDSPPLLVLLDRKNDPLTPLLQPWTYQSMIKEYIDIKRNLVDLSNVPDIDKELMKVTLSSKQDPFFMDTMYLNFGELGDKVKKYVATYRDRTNSNSQINTMEDIKNFIEKYPEFRKLSGNVAKHMAIVGELDRQLKTRDIWELSELEQNISVHDDNQDDFQQIIRLVTDQENKLSSFYKLKLACIYAVRHGDKNKARVDELVKLLASSNFSNEDIDFFHHFNSSFNGKNIANVDLLDGVDGSVSQSKDKDDLLSELAKRFNTRMGRGDSIKKSGNIADNVYMQHVPNISELLSELSKNKLHVNKKYKYYGKSNTHKNSVRPPPQDVIIFVVGGVTFEESRLVHEYNETMKTSGGNIRLILGGTNILTTEEFMNSVRK